MNLKAIKDLGYIYYVTEFNKTVKREKVLEVNSMGNYNLILTENAGLLTFHKSGGVEKGGKVYYLNTKALLNDHKQYCIDKQQYHRQKKLHFQELYTHHHLEEARYKLNFEEVNVKVQEFFAQDKRRLENIYRDDS